MKKELCKLFVEDIIPYDNNPRENDKAVDYVVESIKQCGYVSPIVIDEDNIVLAGHTRLKAFQQLEADKIECLRITGLTEEQKKKYRILDNKTNEFAEWNFELLEKELKDLDFAGYDFGFNTEKLESQHEDLSDTFNEKFEIIITLDNEQEMEVLFTNLSEEGYKCRISTL